MKTRNLFFGAILMAIAGTFTACNEADATIEDLEGDLKSAETAALNCPISGTVTDAEAASILYMWEEEKMAHDVYLYFNDIYKTVPFSTIMGSESVHMLAVERLITGFGLTNTGNTGTGKFNITDLSDLYAELTVAGEKSLVDALAAGALVEETDIADLRTMLLTTKNASVTQVYTNLARASENHLRAFVNALKAQGVTYSPKVLTVEYYNTILAGTSGKFGKGKGKGKGPGFGMGTGTCVQPGAQLGKQYRK